MVKYLIIGSGITGLSCAFFLKKDYLIIEKEDHAGGLASSIEKDGFIFDYGEKFLRIPDQQTKDIFKQLMGENLRSHELASAIYFKEKFIKYPFQENLRDLPPGELQACAKTLINNYIENASKKLSPTANFEELIRFQNGSYISNEFMLPYNEKIWEIPPRDMNITWFLGKNVIPSLDLDTIVKSILPKDPTVKEAPRIRWYPHRGGSAEIGKAFLNHVKNIRFKTTVKKIDQKLKKVTFLDGSTEDYEYLISTMPLNELLAMIDGPCLDVKELASSLKYNSVFCLNLCLDYEHGLPYHWIYFPQKNIPFSRLFFSSNFSRNNAPPKKSSISTLTTFLPESGFDTMLAAIEILKWLTKLNFVKNESRIIRSIPLVIPYGFAIPTIGLAETINTIKIYLEKVNIYPVGRYGEWKYSGIEHAIADGIQISQRMKNA